jgi:hypothetical protein
VTTLGGERADFAADAARALQEIYDEAFAIILQKVSARLARDGALAPKGWAEQKLAEIARMRHEVQQVVSRLDQLSPPAILEAIEAAYAIGRQGGLAVATNVPAVLALARETAGIANAAHPRILRWADDVYREVVGQSVAAVASGVTTIREASQKALGRFAAAGINGFVDRAGANWTIESYVEMAVRTGATLAHTAGTLDRFEATGQELVFVNPVAEDCPLCRPFDGAILSRTGADPRYDSLSSARLAGLLHPSCRHALTAWIEGLTKPAEPIGLPDDYKLRAKQRYYERRVRAAKRRVASEQNFGPSAELVKARAAVKAETARLHAFIDEHGLKRLPYREQIGVLTSRPKPPTDVERLEHGWRSGIKTQAEIGAGQMGTVFRVEFNDGSEAVLKIGKDFVSPVAPQWNRDAVTAMDAEELASRIGRDLMKLNVPAVFRAGPDRVVMTLAHGESPAQVWPHQALALSGFASITDPTLQALMFSDEASRLAVFDAVIGNQDRHEGNWLIDVKRDQRWWLDHGMVFWPDTLENVAGAGSGPFGTFVLFDIDTEKLRTSTVIARGEARRLADAINEMEPEFVRLGHRDWLFQALGRLAELEQIENGWVKLLP